MSEINLFTKLMNMRVQLQNMGIEKTGENKFSKFKYFELDDFLPQCNKVAADNKAIFLYKLNKDEAILTLVNCEDPEEKLEFSMPLAEVTITGASAIQNIGGLATYTRRYLYLIAYEIAEKDELDPTTGDGSHDEKKKKAEQKAIEDKKKLAEQKAYEEECLRIAKQPIEEVKVLVIRKELARTGVSEDALCKRYTVEKIEDITENIFPTVMKALKATKSLESE